MRLACCCSLHDTLNALFAEAPAAPAPVSPRAPAPTSPRIVQSFKSLFKKEDSQQQQDDGTPAGLMPSLPACVDGCGSRACLRPSLPVACFALMVVALQRV